MQAQPASGSLESRHHGASRKTSFAKVVSWRSRAKAALNGKGADAELPKALAVLPAALPVRRHAQLAGTDRSSGPVAPKASASCATIVVAHADEELAASLCADLRREGYNVVSVETGDDALARVRVAQPALILLDLALPSIPGLEVCKHLKADPLTSETQIILLSGDDNEFDRVVGFELGADDCVATPCNLRELVLRVKAVLRRTVGWQDRKVVAVGPIVVDHGQCAVMVNGRGIHVTAIEFKILALLAGRAGVVQSRDTLLTQVWGDEMAIDSRSVDTYLRRLRLKLGSAASHLRTVRGLGYRLVA